MPAVPVLSSLPFTLSSATASALPPTGTLAAAPPSAPPSPIDALLTATQSFGAAPAVPTASTSTGAASRSVAGGAIAAAAAGGALRVATLEGGLYFYSGAAGAVLFALFVWLLLRMRAQQAARAPVPFAARAPAFLLPRQRKAISSKASRLAGSAGKQGLAMTENPLRTKRRIN